MFIMEAIQNLRELATNLVKLERFDGGNFLRWQKKMHFMLVSLNVVYVLSTPYPEEYEEETLNETRRRQKFEHDDEIARGHILNAMSDSLFDIYQDVPSAKELWEKLETRYMQVQRVGEEDMSPKELALEGEIAISSLTTSPCARRDILSYLYCA